MRVEHPDTKGAGDCEGCPRGVGALMCVANGRLRHMLIGYARLSKTDGSQSLTCSATPCGAAGIDDAANLYHDLASGVRDDRAGSQQAACAPRARRKRDVLVVGKLDRLGRKPRPAGVGLRVLARGAGRSHCRKPRCGSPRPRWRTRHAGVRPVP